MFTSRFIHFLDSDEKKGQKEQEKIIQQKEELDLLEDDIREAKVSRNNSILRIGLFRYVTIAAIDIVVIICYKHANHQNHQNQNHLHRRNHHHHQSYFQNGYYYLSSARRTSYSTRKWQQEEEYVHEEWN